MKCRSWGMHCESCRQLPQYVCKDERGPNKHGSLMQSALFPVEYMDVSVDTKNEHVHIQYSHTMNGGIARVEYTESYKFPMLSENETDELTRVAAAASRATRKCIELMKES